MPAVALVRRGDSFERVWPELVTAAEARLWEPPDLTGLGEAAAVLVAVPGVEEDAGELVAGVLAGGGVHIAVVGAAADHRLAVAAMRAGAGEYFALPGDLPAVGAWLADLVEKWRGRARAMELAQAERRSYDFSAVIGESEGVREALELAARVIPRGAATVLITGETGTGKEVFAQAIHYNSPRSTAPFVEVNCTALPANLLEAELFGYEKGAFTDARAAKPGLLETAAGGTLFLDEIGDLPLELQAKLLRVLEQKQVRRLGGLRTLHVDVRIVAATHVDLAQAVRERRFREDLYFRLNVLPIHLPPLRERGRDIVLLAERFLAAFAREYGINVQPLDDDLRNALLSHSWPGNVRELRNALERAVLLGDGRLSRVHLFGRTSDTLSGGAGGELPFPATLAVLERAAAQRMVERLQGNKKAAAEALGISRTRLYRLLQEETGV